MENTMHPFEDASSFMPDIFMEDEPNIDEIVEEIRRDIDAEFLASLDNITDQQLAAAIQLDSTPEVLFFVHLNLIEQQWESPTEADNIDTLLIREPRWITNSPADQIFDNIDHLESRLALQLLPQVAAKLSFCVRCKNSRLFMLDVLQKIPNFFVSKNQI